MNFGFHYADIMLFDDNSELETRVQSKIMPNIENFIFTRESDNLIKCKLKVIRFLIK